MSGLDCSGTMEPAYTYNGIYPPLGKEGRYPSLCFDEPKRNVQVVATVDLAEEGKWWTYGIKIDTDEDGKPDTETTSISHPIEFQGKKAIQLVSRPVDPKHPSINPMEPNPFAGGMAVALSNDGRYQKATHLEVWVYPQTAATLIIELYDQDDKTPANQCTQWEKSPPGPDGCLVGGLGKNPGNFWLPTTGDQYEIKLHLAATGKWQRLLIPLAKFIDWNRAREGGTPGNPSFIPGITENIGDGKLNPQAGEEFTLQLTLVAPDWGSGPIAMEVGREVRFVTVNNRQ